MNRHCGLRLILAVAIASLFLWPLLQGKSRFCPELLPSASNSLLKKGCITCHSLNRRGGNRAPHLARTLPHAPAPELVAAAMWNQATQMWTDPVSGARWNIQFHVADAADLFAYLYSALYFSLPGEATRGQTVFENRGCAGCHKEIQTAGVAGRAISSWAAVNDPVSWAERMWNHSAEMNRATLRKGL
jgi:cytochrome c2